MHIYMYTYMYIYIRAYTRGVQCLEGLGEAALAEAAQEWVSKFRSLGFRV